MPQQSILPRTERGRLQRSRWKALVRTAVLRKVQQFGGVQGEQDFAPLFNQGGDNSIRVEG